MCIRGQRSGKGGGFYNLVEKQITFCCCRHTYKYGMADGKITYTLNIVLSTLYFKIDLYWASNPVYIS